MGGFCSSMTDEDKVSSYVDDDISTAKKQDHRIKKLLLLGAGGSGKSTFFKQLQTIHGHGFSDKDRISFKNHVYHQIIEQMKRIISRAEEFSEDFPEEFGDCKIGDDALDAAEYFELLRDDAPVTEDIAAKIDILWNDEGIKNTFQKRAKFGVTDSTGYFFNEINRISSPNYIPSFEVHTHSLSMEIRWYLDSAILRDALCELANWSNFQSFCTLSVCTLDHIQIH